MYVYSLDRDVGFCSHVVSVEVEPEIVTMMKGDLGKGTELHLMCTL